MLQRLSAVVKDVGLEDEEIKWQKVNEYTEERYKKIIDVLFELLGERERLYKHIRTRIWELHPGFNIGVTTPITKQSDLWERPYLHWNFVPKNFTKNEELTKRHKPETAPYNLHE